MMVIVLLVSGLLASSVDAAITGWTQPVITGAASGSAAVSDPIQESTSIGETGITIGATSNSSGTITYAITDQPTAGLFTIVGTGEDAGKLSIIALLDFETTPTYIITVTATDNGDNSVGTASITLNVGDVDEPPVFTDETLTLCVQQGSSGGADITTATANDPEGASVTYAFTGTVPYFIIDPDSGAVKLADGITLSEITQYDLEIKASDGTLDGLMQLILNVDDCSGVSPLIYSFSFLAILVSIALSLN